MYDVRECQEGVSQIVVEDTPFVCPDWSGFQMPESNDFHLWVLK